MVKNNKNHYFLPFLNKKKLKIFTSIDFKEIFNI